MENEVEDDVALLCDCGNIADGTPHETLVVCHGDDDGNYADCTK